jgi:DNA-binding transcriptional MerR regulator/methylmalonyl-CoA mutase cobalamin-binding subunit
MAADSTPATAVYSIKAVAQATGLSVATLRAWERRYGVIEPKRGLSGHRLYTADEVSRLRRLRETTDYGHPIGKIAHLSNEELGDLVRDRRSDHTDRGAAKMLCARILRAVEQYLPAECDQSIALAFALLPAVEVIREVLAPALRAVGERWRCGDFGIGHERILSSAVRRQVTGLLNIYSGIAKGPTVVFATLSGEHHELGLLMYASLAAGHTLRVDYLGADLPPEVIGEHAHRVDAAAVAVSLVMDEDLRRSMRQLAALRKRLAHHVELWVGGAAALRVEPAMLPKGTIHLAGSRDFEQRVALLAASGR